VVVGSASEEVRAVEDHGGLMGYGTSHLWGYDPVLGRSRENTLEENLAAQRCVLEEARECERRRWMLDHARQSAMKARQATEPIVEPL